MSKRRIRARMVRSRFLVGLLGGALIAGPIFLVQAAESRKQQSAQQLVEEALHREIYGMKSDRQKLLREAVARDANYAPARWQQGFIRIGDDWVHATEAPEQQAKSELTAQYEVVRNQQPNTVAGHLAIAAWCRQQNLADRQRAHLMRVLDFDPRHDQAKLLLGFELVDGEWVSPQQRQQQADRQQTNREAMAKWRGQMLNIREGLHRRNRARRLANEQLEKIDNPEAIVAMEAILSLDSERTALKVIENLDKTQGLATTRSLARHAVYSPWKTVRQRAANALQDRRVDAYIPAMLGAMYQPITSQTFTVRTQGGGMAFRHSLMREGQDERQQVVFDSLVPNSQTQRSIHRQNLQTRFLNYRIAAALNIATDQELPDSPQAWWQWWNETNEVFVEGSKPIVSTSRQDVLARIDRVRDLKQIERNRQAAQRAQAVQLARRVGSQSMFRGRRHDCLAAGTFVWTANGPMAVEKLQVGDMLLSQHAETGELAYKPVLRPTIRPETVLIEIHVGDEIIQASGGHPFWVSGEGWIKARNLRSGMVMHSLNGPVPISTVEEGKKQESYNVVLDDFHTYFVGESKLLSHDNTVRQATDAIVPGLLER